MKSRFLASLLLLIPLAGTLVNSVPPPRKLVLVSSKRKPAPGDLLAQIQQTAQLFQMGRFRDAAALAQSGYRLALLAGEPKIAARFLGNLGISRFALHQYRSALDAYLDALKLAEAAHDNAVAGKLDFNISSLYFQLGQLDAASASLDRARVRLAGPETRAQLPKLFIQMAALQAERGSLPQALDLYKRGIAAADRSGDLEMYALARNDLGYEYLEYEKYPLAEHALLEGYRVRKINRLRSIESSYRNLGMLRLGQADLSSASALLDRAVALSLQPGGLLPAWEVHYARGAVRLRQNRLRGALDDLRLSALLARNWRRKSLPGDATRIGAENKIRKVYSALVQAGNRLYFTTRRTALAQETFESAEANRASSLRVLLAEPRDWHRNLPPEYWETLQSLESAEVALLRSPSASPAPEEKIRQLQAALAQWEARAGSNSDVELPNLLDRTRRVLAPDSAFLAFHLASPNSYLWAVSRERFALYRLPPGPVIGSLVAAYSNATRNGSPQASASGIRLFRILFGQLESAFRNKPRWLLALDAQLFELPFPTLIEEVRAHRPVFLAERHSLQIASGAGMLSPASPQDKSFDGAFLGVADPIYNAADPRWKGSRPPSVLGFFTARASDAAPLGDLNLARLAGTAREVAACASVWNGSRPSVLLEGGSASRESLRAALRSRPAIIHLATHVLHAGQGGRAALIVLSLDPRGQYQVLSPVEIATWNLQGALVSLSGCSSGSAEALPATGLMGLTRACQAAGAHAVVASHWPTPDDSGSLFLSFYRYLRAAPLAGPAVALQHAQLDMLRSGTWRSSPTYWGAYFVTGNQP